MKQRRFVPLTALAGVVTAALITGVVACGSGNGESPAGARAALGGEEVFRGLVFHEGAVAALLPEMGGHVPPRELTPEQRDARERAKARLVADIRQEEPTFFDRFGADIQSGDHLRIEQAMREGGVLVKKVARKASPPASTQGTCCSAGYCDSDYTNVVYASVYDQAYTLDYALDDAVAVVGIDFDWASASDFAWDSASVYSDGGGENGWAGTQLGRDQMIEMIAERLVANGDA